MKLRPIAVLAAGIIISLLLWRFSSDFFFKKEQERFEFEANEIILNLSNKLRLNGTILEGGEGLFSASDVVTRREWNRYILSLKLKEQYPGIQGVGFAKYIRPQDLQGHIREIRAEGFPEFTVHPEGQREEYTSIIYLEPFDMRNQRAFGYDMFTEETRREAMERARDTGLVAMSGKVKLLQETETDVQAGFLLYNPLYNKNTPVNTVEQRRSALLGYVYSPLRVNNFIKGLFPEGHPDIDLEIYDGTEVTEDTLLYDNDSVRHGLTKTPASMFKTGRTIETFGHKWTVLFFSLPYFEMSVNRYLPVYIFTTGIFISFLFFFLVLSADKTRDKAIALDEKNTMLQSEIGVRLRAEAQLIEAKKAAEAANRAKSDFLANMSHELRTPMNSVLGFSEILQDELYGKLNEKQLEYIRDILFSGRHLLRLINDILDLSKVETGRLELEPGRFSLEEVLNSSLTMLKEIALKHHIMMDLKIEPDAAVEIEADERKFKQIMFNLMSNAVKFTKDGGAVRVSARRVREAGEDLIEISVADTGIGIRQVDLPKLFREFTQLEPAYTKEYQGTGLGLALTKRLVELHNGRIRVESKFGKGSTFIFVIPLSRAKE